MRAFAKTLLTAAALCLLAGTFRAAAEEAGDKGAGDYGIYSTKCSVHGQPLAMNVLFDTKLDKLRLSAALGSAFERAGLHNSNCDKAQLYASDNPEQMIAASAAGPRALTLIVYSGNMTEADIAEDGGGATYCSEFAYPSPEITIDDAGHWNVAKHGPGALVPKDAPYHSCYRSPQAFIDCVAPNRLSKGHIPSNYLVQILDLRCTPEPGTHRVLFFGLGSFSEEIRDDDRDVEKSIHEAAYLALEFEVQRAMAPLLR